MNRLSVIPSLLLFLIVPTLPVSAQNSRSEHVPFPESDAPRAQILLLGTFHFGNPGLDGFKPQVEIDIKSPRRQAELELLLQSLEDFHPTKIAVEWSAERQQMLDSSYTSFLAEKRELSSNEIHQVGYRLAGKLNHERLWAIDAPARWYDEGISTEVLIRRAQALGQHELVERRMRWIQQYQDYHAWVDTLKSELSLSEYLLYLNSSGHLKRSHGQYLVGQIEVGEAGDYIGADTRTAWFNRNIRIFSNIQRMVEKPGERVLVIIGAGHASILRHLVESSPEFLLIKPTDYLDR